MCPSRHMSEIPMLHPTSSILDPHMQWVKYSGVFPQVWLGLVSISHSSPYICKYPMTMWNSSWWTSKCLHCQVTGSWKTRHASLNMRWYKYLCSPESLLTCPVTYDLKHLWSTVWLTCVTEEKLEKKCWWNIKGETKRSARQSISDKADA